MLTFKILALCIFVPQIAVLLYLIVASLRGEDLGTPLGEEQWPYGEPVDYSIPQEDRYYD